MKPLMFTLMLSAMCPALAQAQERLLAQPEVIERLSAQTFTLISPKTDSRIEEVFLDTGVTQYIVNDQVQEGRWQMDGAKLCTTYPPTGTPYCYDVFADGTTLIFVSPYGARYVMAPKAP